MKARPIFIQTLAVAILIIILSFFFLIYRYGNLSISGFAITNIQEIKTGIVNTYYNAPSYSLIILITAWALLFFLLIGVFIHDKVLFNREVRSIHLQKNYGKFKTDVDVLYDLLKNKKTIRVCVVAKAFNTTEEKAMEWSKILEEGKLATIEYPGIRGDPELRLLEDKIKEDEKEKA